MTKAADNPSRLPKRFYQSASVDEAEGGFLLRLDGKGAKTRVGRALAAPSKKLGAVIAEEWDACGEFIDFSAMPMTRFVMSLIDLGDSDAGKWRDMLLALLKSDLLCYRASEPAALASLQRAAWDPLLDWASGFLGAPLKTGAGVSFIEQPAAPIAAAQSIIATAQAGSLLGMKAAAEISGSAVIAFAIAENAFPAEALFDASRVDEAYQAERWGLDDEAERRAKRLRADFLDAARFLRLL